MSLSQRLMRLERELDPAEKSRSTWVSVDDNDRIVDGADVEAMKTWIGRPFAEYAATRKGSIKVYIGFDTREV